MIEAGDFIPLRAQLGSGATDKFARAWVWDDAGDLISGAPFALTHVARGLYRNLAVEMPDSKYVLVQVVFYDDSGFSTATEGEAPVLYVVELAPAVTGGGGGTQSNSMFLVGRFGCDGGDGYEIPVSMFRIVQGEDRDIPVRIIDQQTGRPFDLTGYAIEARFVKSDRTYLSKTLAGGAIEVVDSEEKLGEILITLSDSETALLKVGDEASFEIKLTKAGKTYIVPMRRALNIEAAL